MRDITPRKYNKLVSIEYPVTVVDATTKEAAPSFLTLCRAYASIKPLSGRELMNADAMEGDNIYKIEMYCNSKTARLDPRYRIRYDEPVSLRAPGDNGIRYFNVVNVNNTEERNRELVITAKEQVT